MELQVYHRSPDAFRRGACLRTGATAFLSTVTGGRGEEEAMYSNTLDPGTAFRNASSKRRVRLEGTDGGNVEREINILQVAYRTEE